MYIVLWQAADSDGISTPRAHNDFNEITASIMPLHHAHHKLHDITDLIIQIHGETHTSQGIQLAFSSSSWHYLPPTNIHFFEESHIGMQVLNKG